MLIIEEGTLYPLLKKLEKDALIQAERKIVNNRPRKYYYITPKGRRIQNHLTGFFNKLIESMSTLFEMKVELHDTNFFARIVQILSIFHNQMLDFAKYVVLI